MQSLPNGSFSSTLARAFWKENLLSHSKSAMSLSLYFLNQSLKSGPCLSLQPSFTVPSSWLCTHGLESHRMPWIHGALLTLSSAHTVCPFPGAPFPFYRPRAGYSSSSSSTYWLNTLPTVFQDPFLGLYCALHISPLCILLLTIIIMWSHDSNYYYCHSVAMFLFVWTFHLMEF